MKGPDSRGGIWNMGGFPFEDEDVIATPRGVKIRHHADNQNVFTILVDEPEPHPPAEFRVSFKQNFNKVHVAGPTWSSDLMLAPKDKAYYNRKLVLIAESLSYARASFRRSHIGDTTARHKLSLALAGLTAYVHSKRYKDYVATLADADDAAD